MQTEHSKKWARIVAKAWSDPQFKEKLLQNPQEICKQEGLIYEGREIRVFELKHNEIPFLLPEKPKENLTEEELENIAAGMCSPKPPVVGCRVVGACR